MIGDLCGVPFCGHKPVAEWDTIRHKPADEKTLMPVPVCDLHYWVLRHGGELDLWYRG